MSNKTTAFVVGILVILGAVGVYGYLSSSHLGGATPTGPTSNFSWIVASLSVDSPLFRYLDSSGSGVVDSAVQPTRTAFVAATTTPCAIQNPFAGATSTIQSAVVNVTVGTSTAGIFTIATSSTAYATTSAIQTQTIASGAQGTITTGETTSSGWGVIVPPNGFVVVGVAGVPYGFTYTGACTVLWQQVI